MRQDTMLERPRIVTAAVYMVYLSMGLGVIEVLLRRGAIGSVKPVDCVILLTLGLISYKIGRGRNWARVTFLIIIFLGLPLSMLSVILVPDRWVDAGPLSVNLAHTEIVQAGIQLVAVVLLFLRSSSDWFKAIKNIKALADAEPKQPLAEVTSLEKTDIENLVDRIKKELAKGTTKWSVVNVLVKDGWDKEEARQFVKQIALELRSNAEDLPLVIGRYKKHLLEGGTFAIAGIIVLLLCLFVGSPRLESVGHFLLLASIMAVWGLGGWLIYSGRLKFGRHELTNRAGTFRPTRGNLNFSAASWRGLATERVKLLVFIIICGVLAGLILLTPFLDPFIK